RTWRRIRRHFGRAGITSESFVIAELLTDRLVNDGIVPVGVMPHVAEMRAYLETCPTHHGHVKGASVAAHQPGNSTCWAPADVLGAPHFFEFALGFTEIAKEYLE